MIVSHISDTHGNHKKIYAGRGDILIHSGDAEIVTDSDIDDFTLWMAAQKFKTKIFVPGNHDSYIANNLEISKNIFQHRGIDLLINESVYINDIHFYGMPYTPKYGDWDFMCEPEEMKEKVRAIPYNVDILITHGPPKYILDTVSRGFIGCNFLSDKLLSLDVKLHMFGHIHEGYGIKKMNNTLFVNSAVPPTELSQYKWNKGFTIVLDKKQPTEYYPIGSD
jgi:Icc-related predicted phosphoesterase